MTAVLGQAQLRRVFAAFPTGVAAVAAVINREPAGLAANSLVSVSLDPPLVSVCIGHTSTTWPALRTAGRLGISVLGSHQEAVSRQLGSRDGEIREDFRRPNPFLKSDQLRRSHATFSDPGCL